MKKLLAPLALCIALTPFTFVSFGTFAKADDYAAATEALCEKIKSCAMQEMAVEEMSPSEKQMIENMMQGMCVGIQQGYGAAPDSPGYADAAACMRSLADLSCDEIDNLGDENPTAECAAFQEQAGAN